MQGAIYEGKKLWTESFKLQTSKDGHQWHTVKSRQSRGGPKGDEQVKTDHETFQGNHSPGGKVVHVFDPPIPARMVRFAALKVPEAAEIAAVGLRLELYGSAYVSQSRPALSSSAAAGAAADGSSGPSVPSGATHNKENVRN
eukprot:NODE_955_length_1657_cov_29.763682_g786_i0.p3 GENE.NODE_955_length_1657_cov_29.763682_g786_i0~~NODE_955_length_1657_cov_29.763682_g786_i0.p3  ORF type:complete len:142 (+),score=18.27 NODE_955_length_1657_cov_29.763682_g786_i0:1062-1487(+)